MNTMRLSLRQSSLFWIGLAAFALTIRLVDPLREVAVDDDWAYALTVQHLLKTGSYQPYGWLAANMPFQAYWGGFFAHVLGYSFASLRLSTLALVFPGLMAFYGLAREHRLNASQAGLSMLVLCASPLLFRLSLIFNTDVPFLMCFVTALFLYTRAIRLESYPLVLLASIAACAAILTRQFGIALPVGVFSVWVLSKERKGKFRFYAMGLALPVVAALWQISSGLLMPTWVQVHVLHRQGLLFKNFEAVLSNVLWRPMVVLQYLALFSLPFVFLALLTFALEIRQRRSLKLQVLLPALCAFYLVGAVVYGHVANDRPWFLPYIPWMTTLASMSQWQRGALTLVTIVGAILYARILVLRYTISPAWKRIPPSQRLLDLCTFFLLAEHLIYYAFGDRYLLAFLPYVLIAVGHYLGRWLNRWKVAMAIACLAMLLISSLWTRGLMAAAEAKWKAAESIRAAGTDPRQIFGSAEWNLYYGAYDDYIAEIDDAIKLDTNKDFWDRWYPQRRVQSQFLIVGSIRPSVKDKAEVVGAFPYRDSFFRLNHIYVVKRQSLNQDPETLSSW
jgi:hypothetical protein